MYKYTDTVVRDYVCELYDAAFSPRKRSVLGCLYLTVSATRLRLATVGDDTLRKSSTKTEANK